MPISTFDMFKIGIGPSSSHTVGPMKASLNFVERLKSKPKVWEAVTSIKVELYGSLALTGIGHGTDKAVILGLSGQRPETIASEDIAVIVDGVRKTHKLSLSGVKNIDFDPKVDIQFLRRKSLPFHPNALRLSALSADQAPIVERIYYSIGGGFVLDEDEAKKARVMKERATLPYDFTSGKELIEICLANKLTIAQIMLANEKILTPPEEIDAKLMRIWQVMDASIERGCRNVGILPGKLKVRRRAAELFAHLNQHAESAIGDSLAAMDWVNLYAIAVNEENASGTQVVSAPTNGAAGIIPAVLRYYLRFCHPVDPKASIATFLLTAAAIGKLYHLNASISGAEVGCQGEVGVACSMAAAGLSACLGGDCHRVEQAAEIAMEHNLGLTCDPIGGLVQIPCIERNAMGAVKAINAARMSMHGDGKHYVSLDNVIQTMKKTGEDMKSKYKETARGGLAVNIAEC